MLTASDWPALSAWPQTKETTMNCGIYSITNGATQAQLATEFSLNQSTISLIVSGKRWANLPLIIQENRHA